MSNAQEVHSMIQHYQEFLTFSAKSQCICELSYATSYEGKKETVNRLPGVPVTSYQLCIIQYLPSGIKPTSHSII